MRRWAAVVVWASVLVVCAPAGAQRSMHRGYWKSYTPSGDSFACELVKSRQRMERVLRDAGWDPERKKYPEIEWRTGEAVVIAPERFPRGKEMVFYGLYYDGDELVLDYGWQEQPRDDDVIINPDGSAVITSGSRSPSEPSTIVVSFNKDIYEGYRFICSARD